MNRDYISISEYAKIFNLSRQTVYKRLTQVCQPDVNQLSTDCQPLSTAMQMVGNRKMLKISALSDDERGKIEQWFTGKLTEDCQPDRQPLSTDRQPLSTDCQPDVNQSQPETATATSLETVIELLNDRIADKDNEISRLHDEIDRLRDEKGKEIDRLHDQIATLTKLLDQQQQLQARTVQALPDGRRSFFDLFRRRKAADPTDGQT